MKTVYLNEDNTVREIIPEYALPPEKWYSEAFARRCVEVQDNVEQGWRYNPETGQATPDTRPPEPELTPQYAAAMRAYAATSTAIPDTYALDMPDLFPAWETVLAGRRGASGRPHPQRRRPALPGSAGGNSSRGDAPARRRHARHLPAH